MYTPALAHPLPVPTSRHARLRIRHHAKLTSSQIHHHHLGSSSVIASRMSDSGRLHRKGSLGRRLPRKLSGRQVEGKVREGEGASEPSEWKPEHLVILVNGIWGSVKNWVFAAKVLKEKLGEKVVIHCSASNGGLKTHAGVDIMGHRLAEEVELQLLPLLFQLKGGPGFQVIVVPFCIRFGAGNCERQQILRELVLRELILCNCGFKVVKVIETNPGVKKISFVGHSLGGLISRYAIGRLYAPPGGRSLLEERAEASTSGSEAGRSGREHIGASMHATIAGLEPVNFITLATPHLGCRGNSHLPFLLGRAALEWAAPFVSPLIIGPTGRHLFLVDGSKDQRPLLERMATDCDEAKFLSALRCFKRRVAYANVCRDRMVGWRTSSIRKASEMPEPLQQPEEAQRHLSKYVYIVRQEEVPRTDKESSEPKDAPALDDIEEIMVAGLQQVPWERIDVNFSKIDRLYEAHNLIQVKNQAWHSEGKHVIYHIIDNYF